MIFVLQSCNEPACDWKGGEITDYGTYCNDDFKINVYEKDNYLKYEVRNKKEDVIIRQNVNISIVHHWGLFLDNDKNLWVFSSDIGDSIWKMDSLTGKYNNRIFHHWLTRDSVPSELYASSLRRFLK
ncbi:MAG: hypothetical protein ACKO96_24100 [Flammeovirgaceae bacterium]